MSSGRRLPCARVGGVLVLNRVHATNMSRLQRRTQLFSHILADMSAIAACYGIDDTDIMAAIVPGGDCLPQVLAFRQRLAAHYPIETLWLHFLVRFRAWPLAHYVSTRAVMTDVAIHLARRLIDPKRWALAWRAARYLRRGPDVYISDQSPMS